MHPGAARPIPRARTTHAWRFMSRPFLGSESVGDARRRAHELARGVARRDHRELAADPHGHPLRREQTDAETEVVAALVDLLPGPLQLRLADSEVRVHVEQAAFRMAQDEIHAVGLSVE